MQSEANRDWWAIVTDKYEGYKLKAKGLRYRIPLIAIQDAAASVYNFAFPWLSQFVGKAYDSADFGCRCSFYLKLAAP